MTRPLFLLIFLSFSFCINVRGQSIQEKLEEADNIRDTDPAKSNLLLDEILETDSTEVPLLIRARALQLLGLSEMYNNQFESANKYFGRSFVLFEFIDETEKSKNQKASLIFDIGRILTWKAQYDSALQNFIMARRLYLEVNYPKGVATALNAIAIIYAQFNQDYQSALKAFREAMTVHGQMEDTLSIARTMQNIGQLYQITDEQDSALYYLNQSNIYCEKYEDNRSLAIGSNMIGTVYYALQKFDSSEFYFRQASRLNLQLEDSIGLESDYTWLSKTFLAKKDYARAERYSSIVFENTNDLSRKYEVSQMLSQIYEETFQFRKALKFHKTFKFFTDSVKSENQSQKISELQTKYETQRKEQEIEKLKLSNELADSQLSETRWQMTFILAGSITLIALAIFLYWLKTKRDKAVRIEQMLRFEALQKRYADLLHGPTKMDLDIDLMTFNGKLVNPLTEREYDVLRNSMSGKTNQEIADVLFVSLSTIKFHIGNIYNKLGVSNKKEALEYVAKTS